MNDGFQSKDRNRINARQRERRARMIRIDYMPAPEAVAILQARRAKERPRTTQATNSAILDAIVTDWARLTGINYSEVEKPPTSGGRPEYFDTYARANDFGFCQTKRAPAHAPMTPGPASPKAALRVPCKARRRRDGLPCEALSVPGMRRCKWHDGASTGPKTVAGRRNALSNLRQNRLM
jgi:hypothetical protein